jgi:hypothetical protein
MASVFSKGYKQLEHPDDSGLSLSYVESNWLPDLTEIL